MFNYKFQDINKDITEATIQKNILIDINKNQNITNLYNDPNITIGGKFNVNEFNQHIDKVFSNIQQQQNIEDKIKKLKEKSTIPDPNSMTLNQFISGLILDTYDMFNELFKLETYSKSNLNMIMNKNYRKITLYIIIIIIIIIIYNILSIKSYLFSEVLNN